ncbi:40S ribosomal protein S10-1-like protein [Tanacetum coccineum]
MGCITTAFVTNDGIKFLRTYLNLPSDIVPATLKKSAKPLGRPMGGPGDCPRGDGDRPRFGDRDGYLVGPEDLLVISVATKVELLLIISLLLTGQGAGRRPSFGRGGGGFGGAAPPS